MQFPKCLLFHGYIEHRCFLCSMLKDPTESGLPWPAGWIGNKTEKSLNPKVFTQLQDGQRKSRGQLLSISNEKIDQVVSKSRNNTRLLICILKAKVCTLNVSPGNRLAARRLTSAKCYAPFLKTGQIQLNYFPRRLQDYSNLPLFNFVSSTLALVLVGNLHKGCPPSFMPKCKYPACKLSWGYSFTVI